ncbi:MAG: hypothetical protein FWG30_06285 [Eubacteriaceae bacterium]|nr:hypothetical protein [Eubacteriaceae bacterium]
MANNEEQEFAYLNERIKLLTKERDAAIRDMELITHNTPCTVCNKKGSCPDELHEFFGMTERLMCLSAENRFKWRGLSSMNSNNEDGLAEQIHVEQVEIDEGMEFMNEINGLVFESIEWLTEKDGATIIKHSSDDYHSVLIDIQYDNAGECLL